MFDSMILEVAIGLVFIYLVLSLISTSAQELIEAWLRFRATNLERGLKELLQDPAGTGLVQALYQHPLIDSLFKGDYSSDPDVRKQAELPTYIPAGNFAVALMHLIQHGEEPPNPTALPAPPAPGTPAIKPIDTFRQSVIDSPLLKANPDVQRAIFALIDAAGDDVNQVRKNIETWFNSAMDRVSGWYKRRSQIIVLVIGLAISVLANADTLAIGDALSRQKGLRQALVASADQFATTDRSVIEGNPDELAKKAETIAGGLKPLGLPLGWGWQKFDGTAMSWFHRILGWLITALAISLGAPFWFDVLNKIMVIRSTVKPREKSQEQASRD